MVREGIPRDQGITRLIYINAHLEARRLKVLHVFIDNQNVCKNKGSKGQTSKFVNFQLQCFVRMESTPPIN